MKILLSGINSIWPYLLIMISCITGYFITKSITGKRISEKEITYSLTTSSDVLIVWAMMDGSIPSQSLWPEGSYYKDELIWTKMENHQGHFSSKLRLPAGSIFYYWIVYKEGKEGTETDVWDSGGINNLYYTENMPLQTLFKPGYFIFLAGAIPLGILFLRNRKKNGYVEGSEIFKMREYIPQFDSMRAIAVLLVIIHHWISEESILNFLSNGRIGVNVFFVLSGFLITGILLKSKLQAETSGISKAIVFKNFYIRRTLRIFPIYYLLLIILWILRESELRQNAVYYFTYTSNLLNYSEQLFPGRLAHLWSLAVEEQFYLLWPWLMILVRRRYLPYLISLFIVIGISSNYIFTEHGWWVEILTPACFDAFAIGAFLSHLTCFRQDIIERIQPVYKWLAGLILMLFILDAFEIALLPSRTSHALLAAAIIYYCLFKSDNKILNYLLNTTWLIRLGKISYGVYLYHLFVPEIWDGIIQKFASWNIDLFYNEAIPEILKPSWLFIQQFCFLMLICILSWKVIEKPINGLKRKFENKLPQTKLA